MRRSCRIRSFLLAGLLAFVIPPSTARAVSISLVPDGSTTIEIGETVNVDVFMVLDASDQAVGISAATLHLELGAPFVDVVASSGGSVFQFAIANVVPWQGFIAFVHFRGTVTSPTAQLGTLAITGENAGSYDLVARRFGAHDHPPLTPWMLLHPSSRTALHWSKGSLPDNYPLFTAPQSLANRYDFTSDETLRITVCDGACPIASPTSPPPQTIAPEYEIYSYAWWKLKRQSETTLMIISNTDTVFHDAGSVAAVPEPHTFALLGLALTGLMFLRGPRREPSKRSPGS